MRIRVKDAYEQQAGSSSASLFGIVPIGAQPGSREMNEASLARFLAESVWIPPFLRDRRIEWEEREPQTLRAHLTDGGVSAWVDFKFRPSGEIAQVETERYRDVRGSLVLTPWRGTFQAFEPIDGMMVPSKAFVEWLASQGPIEVWRGRVDGAVFVAER